MICISVRSKSDLDATHIWLSRETVQVYECSHTLTLQLDSKSTYFQSTPSTLRCQKKKANQKNKPTNQPSKQAAAAIQQSGKNWDNTRRPLCVLTCMVLEDSGDMSIICLAVLRLGVKSVFLVMGNCSQLMGLLRSNRCGVLSGEITHNTLQVWAVRYRVWASTNQCIWLRHSLFQTAVHRSVHKAKQCNRAVSSLKMKT